MKTNRFGIVVVSLVLSLSASAFADKVFYDGLEYGDATVNGYNNGALSVTLKSGVKKWDLSKVKWIDLDATPKMRQAENVRTSNPIEAASLYKEAIQALNDPDLRQLAELRAIAPADADGKWLDALHYFLDVYQANPTPDVWKLRPTHLPAVGSTLLAESAQEIASRMPKFSSDEAVKNLKTMQLELYTKAGDPRADALARELSGLPPESAAPQAAPAVKSPTLDAVTAAIKAKDYAGALKKVNELLPTAPDAVALQLYQLKAAALEGQNDLGGATAALLRVPAFYPESSEAPACLLEAADLQKKANHPAEAKRLLMEIVQKYPDSPAAIRAKGG